MSKQANQDAATSKGVRRHNASHNRGTINQGVAASDPKWAATKFSGLLFPLVGGNTGTLIAMKGNRWQSVSRRQLWNGEFLPIQEIVTE